MKPTRLMLERWLVGDLDENERRDLEQAMHADPELRRRADELTRQAAAVQVPPLRAPRRRPVPWAPLLGVVVAALVALVVITPRSGGGFRGAAFDLDMVRVRLGKVQPVGAIVETRAGDRLQWVVEPERDGFVHVFDVQDNGAVQAWMPAQKTGARQIAEGAVLLDDYDGQERVYVIVGPRPLTEADVRDALSKAHRVPLAELDELPGLGRDVGQRSILVLEAL